MSFDTDTLYNLLPATYRVRDDAQGGPLKALLAILAQEALGMEENLAQLYDDLFIETCAEWVAPYIGDLIGYRLLRDDAPGLAGPRAEIANTIGYRRRKGTAAMLEQLAHDVTGMPAHVVEFFQLLATTQYMNHLRPENLALPGVRPAAHLRQLGTPFERLPHTADVRRIASGRGRYNIPNIGLFLWRTRAAPLTFSPALRLDDLRATFSPLGNSAPLFNNPQSETSSEQLAGPLQAPLPITCRALHHRPADFYGPERSIAVYRDGELVPLEEIVACDLSDDGAAWAYQPADKLALDPELGRLALPTNVAPPADLRVSFCSAAAANLGGGEYERAGGFDETLAPVQVVAMPANLQDALDASGGEGAIEIRDSGRYEEALSLTIPAGGRLEIRAANGRFPTLIPGEWLIDTGDNAELVLDGLRIAGSLRVRGSLRRLVLRNCTLVPGLTLDNAGMPMQPEQPSLIIESASVVVEIERCILGAVQAATSAAVSIRDSVLDATDETRMAYAGIDAASPGAPLSIDASTVIGRVWAHTLELASNSIFLAKPAETVPGEPVRAERLQHGCVRFCYVPPGSRTPRRYQCLPTDAGPAAQRPQLRITRYGQPGYALLSLRSAASIRSGASDGGELGAFHHLALPQRLANLRVRLEEYLRFGLEAGVILVD